MGGYNLGEGTVATKAMFFTTEAWRQEEKDLILREGAGPEEAVKWYI